MAAVAGGLVSTTLALSSGRAGAQSPTVAWTPATPNPEARYGHSLAYDAETQQVVLFGGVNNDGILGDTWTGDGTT